MLAAADPLNFYLAASGLIPVLALADVVIRRRWIAIGKPQAVVDRLNRLAPWVETFAALMWMTLFGWAEVVCLRKLETGHAPFGGAFIVWFVLAILWLQTTVFLFVNKLGQAMPSRFLDDETAASPPSVEE